MLAVYQLTLRQLSGRWRLLIMTVLAAMPVVIATLMLRSRSRAVGHGVRDRDPERDAGRLDRAARRARDRRRGVRERDRRSHVGESDALADSAMADRAAEAAGDDHDRRPLHRRERVR